MKYFQNFSQKKTIFNLNFSIEQIPIQNRTSENSKSLNIKIKVIEKKINEVSFLVFSQNRKIFGKTGENPSKSKYT